MTVLKRKKLAIRTIMLMRMVFDPITAIAFPVFNVSFNAAGFYYLQKPVLLFSKLTINVITTDVFDQYGH